jgi:hypothetical protein
MNGTAPGTDLLSGLRDIHLPDPIPFWPPAPGWWMAAGLALAVVITLLWVLKRRREGLRRAARLELARLTAVFEQDGDTPEIATGLALLMRRVALARFRRTDVAGLHGEAWTEFLARSGRMTTDTAEALATAVYSHPAHTKGADVERWVADVRDWIRRVA